MLAAVALFFQKCSNQEIILADYDLKDSVTGFYFYRDSVMKFNNNKFYKFRLNLLDDRIYLDGYLGIKSEEYIFYYPEIKQKTAFKLYNKESKCDSTLIFYYIVADSIYSYEEIKEICQSELFISGKGDTVFKTIVHDFSLLKELDDLALYFSKRSGIVGWASQLKDGNILYYKGNIYEDSLKVLEKLGKKLE